MALSGEFDALEQWRYGTRVLRGPRLPWTIAGLAVSLLGSACSRPDAAEELGVVARPVVLAERPLVLENPQDEAVLWPLWGAAFVLPELSIAASIEGVGASGLVIAGPGSLEDRAAVELWMLDGAWTLRETLGGDPIRERATELEAEGELSLTLTRTELRLANAHTERRFELAHPLGPDGTHAGLYVALEPGAELTIDALTLSEPLPSHPELGPPLRELGAARGIEVGTAFDVWPPLHDLELESLLAEQFGRLAPTEFYWATTRGEDQDFSFIPADLAVNYATVHEQAITGMFLIWDFALPGWVYELDSPALEAAFDEHITTIVDRYEDRVDTWVVVNEAIWGAADTGEEARYAENLWFDALGPGYIERAFELARAADPDAVLLYNETGVEALDDKSDYMYAMLVDLLDRGAAIDGIGLQFHIHAGSPPAFASVRANMERFAALGLSIHVTELDVSLEGLELPEAEALELQAQIYVDVLETCLAVPGCASWTVFGFGDRYAWDELGDAAPLLFDADWTAKPAYFAVQDALR